jgi:hypothetical protein
LTLAVVYDVDGIECPIVVEAKFVDKLIKSAEDLSLLGHQDGDEANIGYYVLADDINASSAVIEDTAAGWQDVVGFRGVLEGNGHTISGLTIGSWKNGLFGALGMNAKVQNISFTDVKLGDGSSLFALVGRKAKFTNVKIEFSKDSASTLLFDTANGFTFENVSVKTCVGTTILKNVDDAAMAELPTGITRDYYTQYTISFNTDGGNAIDSVAITEGMKAVKPVNPTKASDDTYDYTFAGWFYNGEEFSFDTPITGNIELVAQWTATEKLNETLNTHSRHAALFNRLRIQQRHDVSRDFHPVGFLP